MNIQIIIFYDLIKRGKLPDPTVERKIIRSTTHGMGVGTGQPLPRHWLGKGVFLSYLLPLKSDLHKLSENQVVQLQTCRRWEQQVKAWTYSHHLGRTKKSMVGTTGDKIVRLTIGMTCHRDPPTISLVQRWSRDVCNIRLLFFQWGGKSQRCGCSPMAELETT